MTEETDFEHYFNGVIRMRERAEAAEASLAKLRAALAGGTSPEPTEPISAFEQKHTPEAWAMLDGFRIVDPDGWRTADSPPFDEPISRAEFDRRVSASTLDFGRPVDVASEPPNPPTCEHWTTNESDRRGGYIALLSDGMRVGYVAGDLADVFLAKLNAALSVGASLPDLTGDDGLTVVERAELAARYEARLGTSAKPLPADLNREAE